MSKRQLLCLLGVWVMVIPFLGIPSTWSWIVSILSGLLIVFISYNLPHQKRDSNHETSIDSNNFTPNI